MQQIKLVTDWDEDDFQKKVDELASEGYTMQHFSTTLDVNNEMWVCHSAVMVRERKDGDVLLALSIKNPQVCDGCGATDCDLARWEHTPDGIFRYCPKCALSTYKVKFNRYNDVGRNLNDLQDAMQLASLHHSLVSDPQSIKLDWAGQWKANDKNTILTNGSYTIIKE